MGKTYTSNYNLTKDDENEFYNVAVQSENMELIDGALKALSDEKVSHIEGKGLSTNDYSDAEKQKLAKIPEDAIDYQHPATHSLDMITETAAKKIMTSAERSKLAGIQSGAQVNAVTSVAGKTGAVSLSKADVGLSAILNYGVATQAEAEAGTSDTKYMTPLRVKEAVDTNVKIAHGSYTGNGDANRNITVGFTPKKVIIGYRRSVSIITFESWSRQISGSAEVFEEVLLTSTGFSLGLSANARINCSGATYDWTAIG